MFKEVIINNIPAHILTLVSIALIIAGFICPPLAVIDNSVLIAVGELTGIGAMWCVIKAIDKGVDASIKHKGTEITIDNNNK